MKKQFGKLFIIFGVILCIFALVGCDLIFVDNPDPEKNPAEESSSETVESSENPNEESSEEPVEETTEETWENGPIEAEGNELIAELVDYLQELNAFHSVSYKSWEDKINDIKKGTQPIHIVFDSTQYYYVCGYFSETDRDYNHTDKYTWVRFKKEGDIQEYYNDERIIVAFQINTSSSAVDIVQNNRAVSKVEHFQLYKTQFVDGVNVNAAISFDETFIYLNSSDKHNIYYSTGWYYNPLVTLKCINFDGEYYLPYRLYQVYNNVESEVEWEYIEEDFGKYYDVLRRITVTENYSSTSSSGVTTFYGLIPIEDFANEVLK